MPDSRHKYLYERLGDHDFQQLVGALLTIRFPDFVPMPLRQADGGRDGVDPTRRLVYQVKWSVTGQEKNPVSWLDAEIARESDKIKRFAAEGTRRYVLVTNVPSTGTRETGTFDKLNAKLDEYSKEFGLQMSCIWREALNPMVDSAPTETKWAYADMLAGWDLVRYLISEQADAAKDSGLRDLIRKVTAAQWGEDERIKFSQVELDREHLAELFVDVPADRVRVPRRLALAASSTTRLGGAAAYIAGKSPYPFTLVLGAPGQGKSTLSQFICQAFRIAFVPGQTASASGLPEIKDPRFPIRFDLGDYAAWIQGYDVFDKSDTAQARKGKRRSAAKATIESFLAELMTHNSGRDIVTSIEVQELFERVPSLIVLDGLDEVGNAPDRKRIVKEIDLFCARGKSYAVEPKVIVTTRPNSAGLEEPNPDIFEVISLGPLDAALRDEYLRKWCVVHNVRGNDSRTLRRNFTEKTREPYIGELAGNPMQLTILLFLLRQHGDATPSQRTELYDAYMNLLLAREANKHPESIRKHRADLMEIVPFLGWYLQSRAEEDGHSGRMADDEVEAAMKHFQRTYGKPEDVVDELFEAATDRLWALTSKEEGTFEFEVLSLREYFTARYLYRYAGEGDHRFDRTIVFRELLRRPYWLNTVRFYGGNATGSDIYVLEAGIKHELNDNLSKHVRVAAWSLVSDGVFNSRPQEAATVVDALTDDHGSRLLLEAFDGKEITPLPETSHANLAWKRLTAAICANPDDPQSLVRVRILRELLGLKSEFSSWWASCLNDALGTSSETAWLNIGAGCEVTTTGNVDIPALSAEDGQHAQLILNTGLVPAASSPLENQLIRAVLDGQCSETMSVRSEPAQIAVALSPAEFYMFGSDSRTSRPSASSSDRRSQAIQQLRKSGSPFTEIAGLRRFRKGEKGSTFPWANASTALLQHVGRCWLVSEIALIGAASPLRNGYTVASGTVALGSASHPATLIAQTRLNRANAHWWCERLAACDDDLARAEWALALWSVAEGHVIDELRGQLAQAVEQISPRLQRALKFAAQRMVEAGFLSQRIVPGAVGGKLPELFANRHLSSSSSPVMVSEPQRIVERNPKPLASVARRAKWLKVDQIAIYR
ncbi:NACHT domain-containing protein [Arthrobacter sp. HLT1-21]